MRYEVVTNEIGGVSETRQEFKRLADAKALYDIYVLEGEYEVQLNDMYDPDLTETLCSVMYGGG